MYLRKEECDLYVWVFSFQSLTMDTISTKKIDTGTRIGAMVLDCMIMSFLAIVFLIPGWVQSVASAFSEGHDYDEASGFYGMDYIGLIGFALYFGKDSIQGRSIAKRLLKLQVVDNQTGEAAGPLPCLVRNVLTVFWPIEFFVALANPSRRWGDRMAGTKLVYYNSEAAQPPIPLASVMVALGLSYGMVVMVTYPFHQLLEGAAESGIEISKSSYNEQASLALEEVLSDRLVDYGTPDVEVYDTIVDSRLKYISIVVKMDYYYSDDEADSLDAMMEEWVCEQFPCDSCVGHTKYVHKTSSMAHIRSGSFGVGE